MGDPNFIELSSKLVAAEGRIAELQTALLRADTLRAAAQSLGSSLSLDETFDTILSELQKVVPYDSSSVQVTRDGRLTIVGGRGFDDPKNVLGLSFELEDESNPSIQVLRSRRHQVFGDVSHHPHFASAIHGGGRIRGWICVPMLFDDRLVGVITLDKFEPDFYDEELAELALAFAAQAAIAIEHARLFEEEREAREQADTLRAVAQTLGSSLDLSEVSDLILSELRKVVPYDSSSIQQIEGDKLRIVGVHGFEHPEEVIGLTFGWGRPGDPATRVIDERQSIIIADVSAQFDTFKDETDGTVKGWMGVPLIYGERLIGMLTLDNRAADFYTEDHARVAIAFAAYAASAIDNARSFETERVAREQAETLRAAAQALSSTLDLQQIFALILSELRKVVPFDSGSIQRIDGRQLVIVGAHGFANTDDVIGQRFGWDKPGDPAAKVIAERHSVIIDDVSTQFESFTDDTAGEAQVRGWMGVPLIYGERLIGILTLDSHRQDFYTPENARLAEAFAAYAASAIENARLLNETKERAAELGAINKISQALVAESELERTIDLIGRLVQDLFAADIAYVAIVDPATGMIDFPYQHGIEFPPLKLGEGLTSKIIAAGEPLLINEDVAERIGSIGATLLGANKPLSYLGVPIETANGVIGVISVQSTQREGHFDDDSLRLLTTIAANAGAALHNAQLFSEALEHLRQVEVLTDAAAAIEQRTFAAEMIDSVAGRTDALGELARVFRNMAQEVRVREQRLRRQLQQMQLDIEEEQQAAAATVAVFIPMDRRQALAQGLTLPPETLGSALFADISGFTALTEQLAIDLGLQRGAEEIIRHLNRVFTVLIDEVHKHGGSVIGFAGDAITCWFDDRDLAGAPRASASLERAVAAAVAMQNTMAQFAAIATPSGGSIGLEMKVAVASGAARRFVTGTGTTHEIDVLAGGTLEVLAEAEHAANRREIVVATTGIDFLAERIAIEEMREGDKFALVNGVRGDVAPEPWPELTTDALSDELARPWLLPEVYEKVRAGKSDLLSELRPVTALFVKFDGINFDQDVNAPLKFDRFIRWVEEVIAPKNGSIIQVTVGDKGSYFYAVFGAPVAYSGDVQSSVEAALALAAPPPDLDYITRLQMGLASGQMRVGAYGGTASRTYGALGDKANLAARLMMAAGKATTRTSVLCDESVVWALQGQFEFESLPSINVKGKSEPVSFYRPTGRTRGFAAPIAPRGPADGIAFRMDELTSAEQTALKVASIFGTNFTLETLSAVYPEQHSEADLAHHLDVLREQGFVIPYSEDPSSWKFQDETMRESAYSLMLFAQRRQLHRAVAELLEQGEAEETFAEVAHHWQAADDIPKAVLFLEKAGEAARIRGDLEGATRYFNASLALNP